MKTVILEKQQYIKLMETDFNLPIKDTPEIEIHGDNREDLFKEFETASQQVANSGLKGARLIGSTDDKTITNDNNIEFTGQGETAVEQAREGFDDASKAGADDKNITVSSTVGQDGLPIANQNESKIYTKAQIKEAIKRNLCENSVKMSKAELIELLNK